MGIRFFCPNGHKLNVKDFQAGQTGICPYCGVKMPIPLESTRPSSKQRQSAQQGGDAAFAPASATATQPPFWPSGESLNAHPVASGDPLAEAEEVVWYVHPPSGGQFGPAAADVMRAWIAEGRIGPNSLVWREGWREWQMAGNVFPQLSPPPAASGLEPEVAKLVVTPVRSSVVPGHRRPRFQIMQIVVIGSLTLAVIILFFILHAVLAE